MTLIGVPGCLGGGAWIRVPKKEVCKWGSNTRVPQNGGVEIESPQIRAPVMGMPGWGHPNRSAGIGVPQ